MLLTNGNQGVARVDAGFERRIEDHFVVGFFDGNDDQIVWLTDT